MANNIVITQGNGTAILVVNTGIPYTLLNTYRLRKEVDKVAIVSDLGGDIGSFTPEAVEKVVFLDGSEVVINNIDDLYTELESIFTNAVGKTGHDITGIADGRKTIAVAGTSEKLIGVSTPAKRVTITAETDNTGVICVGGSGVIAALVTRTGTPLEAGDTYEFDVDNLEDVFIDTTVNGDGVTFTYFT